MSNNQRVYPIHIPLNPYQIPLNHYQASSTSHYVLPYIYIYDPVFRPRGPPPEWDGSPGSTPVPFYLQAIGSISEIQPRIC